MKTSFRKIIDFLWARLCSSRPDGRQFEIISAAIVAEGAEHGIAIDTTLVLKDQLHQFTSTAGDKHIDIGAVMAGLQKIRKAFIRAGLVQTQRHGKRKRTPAPGKGPVKKTSDAATAPPMITGTAVVVQRRGGQPAELRIDRKADSRRARRPRQDGVPQPSGNNRGSAVWEL